MRKNKSYWERRAIDRINRYTEDAEKTADLIGKAYFQAEQYFEEEAKKVFQGFQNAFELSESEAKRLLNVKPDEKAMDSLRKALEKITDPEERNNALAQLSSPAYQYRINRLDKLNEEIAATCNELYKTELNIDKRFLAAETDKAYKSMMFDIQKGTGVSGAFDMLPKSYINQVLNTNWSGEHFSTRIWGNTTKLAADLKQDLLVGMLTGQSERDMAATIMERTGTSSFNARRLIRTETTYVTNQAELKSYEEAEIDKYEFSACIDGRTSKLCRELDGKTFKVKDGKPGKNLPPMHPFCRSTTLAVLPSEEELDKAFGDFKADNIPEGMDFDEWLDGLEPTEDGKLAFKPKDVTKNSSNYSYSIEGSSGAYRKQADEIIDGVKSVLSDFDMESEFTRVYFDDSQKAEAAMDAYGCLTIYKPYLAKGASLSNGYFVNDTLSGAGAHEAGHLVSYCLLKSKVMPNASLLEKAVAREKCKLEKAILKEAKKRYGSNPAISGYGSTNAGEKIAEAVSDVYSNKSKANPYSKVIVSIMKEINSGKFIPKI